MDNEYTLIFSLPKLKLLGDDLICFIKSKIDYESLKVNYFGLELDCAAEFIYKQDEDVILKTSYFTFYFCAENLPLIDDNSKKIIIYLLDQFNKDQNNKLLIFNNKDAEFIIKNKLDFPIT
jgi:hypothetical protein